MMLLYGLVRCIAVALQATARRTHKRAKALYEARQTAFDKLESECKAEEVSLGRPMDYPAQLRLLNNYEQTDKARQKWIRAEARVKKREAFVERVRGFQTARMPYTFGLIDMTLAMRLLDHSGLLSRISIPAMIESAKLWFTT